MSLDPQDSSGASRVMAVAMGVAAIFLLLQQEHSPESLAAAVSPPILPSTQVAAFESAPKGQGWLMRTGGWYIRVDGAEIELPSFARPQSTPELSRIACPVSEFDDLIIRNAKKHGFDWRLVAALIFEESRFKPDSRSSKGAVGLMQVRPIAAEQVGMDHFEAPADNIQAGVKYLRHLDNMFGSAPDEDRLGLILAAYNMGPAHVRDAQMLAQRYGVDPNRWQLSMERILPLLEEPQINKDLPAGFARGSDTVAYVDRVLRRYKKYKLDMADAPAVSADALSTSEEPFGNG